ncbi:hypothetical protein DICVIV_03894 [Dictyocaulus viviparus]|uniref:Major facilitator superfamily (MFS) profile domain-containing protein n=1 Tax=Dictyocaulus viviparus TaxID=29172 RepID=A0A0D8Y1C1_DICVI|nr:hypothetical protein DICVIV_03894 [Dictyocaulus viviparus]
MGVITGVGGMYITDNYGIRLSILCGTSLNFVGSLIRVISSIPLVDGSIVAASAQAFFLVLPSKIAEIWFPDHQRSLANVLTFIGNFTKRKQSTDDLYVIENASMALITTLTFILSLFIRHGSPPTPPSASSEYHSKNAPSFWKSIVACLRNKQFLIQLFTFGLAFAELYGFMVIMSDIIIDRGYALHGYPTALAAFVGVMVSLICGLIADYTKKFKELIRASSAGLGAFSTPQFPIGIEMGVETTFPVYEATSSGLLILTGQLLMFIMYFVFEMTKNLKLFYKFEETSPSGNWQCWFV